MKRNFLNSPRLLELKKHKRRIVQNKILLSLFSFLIFLIFLALISRIPSFNIRSVEIVNTKVSDTQAIKETAEKIISGNYLWLLPRANVLFYPQNTIKAELYDKFKKVKDITFAVRSGNALTISISERIATYMWCGANVPSELDERDRKCYFMDKDGYIFDEAAYFSGDVYFKFYGEVNPETDVPSGSYFYPQNFQKMVLFKKMLEDLGLSPNALHAEKNGDVRMFLSLGASSPGPEIIFNIDSDLNKIQENLEVALTSEPLRSKSKNKYSSLLYIDLRYGNRVFYKFK